MNISNVREQSFDPEEFREVAKQVVDLMADYLLSVREKESVPVLPYRDPALLLSQWKSEFPIASPTNKSVASLLKEVITQSLHIHHPRFVGHQVCAPLPVAAICDFVSTFLNNGSAIYEMGPLATVLECRLIEWMGTQLGWDGGLAGGFFTSGGSIGNLTALLAAQQVKTNGTRWKEGAVGGPELAVLVSDQAHYSIKRAIQLMGWGEKGAILVPTDSQYKMDIDALSRMYDEATATGKRVIAVVASECSTSTGSFDDIDAIADFCHTHSLWLHVDGAHGAPAILSPKYRVLLKGIERADSVVWDAHKMMLMPALTTAVLFKDKSHSYQAFTQSASYIYDGNAEDEWYNLGQRTLECTKSLMAMKLYVSFMTYGTEYFADYITSQIDLTRHYASYLRTQPDFELPLNPECNIICFRYCPEGITDIDTVQSQIRQKIVESGEFYLVKTALREGTYLRLTIINPLTSMEDLVLLTKRIREVGADLMAPAVAYK